MKNPLISLSAACLVILAASATLAQDYNPLDNPNNSSFPPSNQPGSPPNDADSNFGRSAATRKLPSGAPILQGTTSDPTKLAPADADGTDDKTH